MPQWRKLHTKITESLDVADMPDDFTRLLWVLLPTQLCREGRGVDSPSWVRSKVFPLREDVTLAMVSAAMDWYETRGMIVRYQVDGRSYFWVPTFTRYQGNTERETASEYPAPPEHCMSNSRVTHEQVVTNSCSDADADADADSDLDADAEGSAAAARAPVGYGKVLANHGIVPNGAFQADNWRDLYQDYGETLFTAALDEAARSRSRVPTVNYVETILKRCRDEGVMPGEWKDGRNNGNGSRASPSPLAGVDAAIEEYLKGG